MILLISGAACGLERNCQTGTWRPTFVNSDLTSILTKIYSVFGLATDFITFIKIYYIQLFYHFWSVFGALILIQNVGRNCENFLLHIMLWKLDTLSAILADMGIEKTTEHESGYFEEDEDEDEGRTKKEDERSVSEVSSTNNDCDVTVSDCSEDNIYYPRRCRDKGRWHRNIR